MQEGGRGQDQRRGDEEISNGNFLSEVAWCTCSWTCAAITCRTYFHAERKRQHDPPSGESSLISLSDNDDQDDLLGMHGVLPTYIYHVLHILS